MILMQLEFYGYGISRTMLACAGIGATMGMLVGGTTFGVPTAIVAATIGAIGGGVLVLLSQEFFEDSRVARRW